MPEISVARVIPDARRNQSNRPVPPQYSDVPASGGSSSQLAELKKQMAQMKQENQRLADKLAQANANYQMAMVEIDKRKVLVVSLKADLAQATQALEDLQKDSSRDSSAIPALRQRYEKQVADLTKALNDAQNDNIVLEEENGRLVNKVEKAANYITTSDQIRQSLIKDRETLADDRDKLAARQKRIKDNQAEIEKIAQENKTLKGKLENIADTTVPKDQYVKVTTENKALKGKLDDIADTTVPKTEFQKSTAENKTLKTKLDNIMDDMVKKADYEKLVSENKTLAEKLARGEKRSANKEDLDKLAGEKKAVEEKLAAAEKALKDAAAASPDKDKQIASLQSELNGVNDKLLEAQSQTAKSDEMLKTLQGQLDETSGKLAEIRLNPNPTKEEKTLASENELLRGIILRQIKEQAQRDEARKLVDQEVSKLQVKSEVLNRQLSVLSAPVLQLSAEEKALFKEPMALLNEPNDGTMTVAMAISSKQPGTKETPDKQADAVPDDVRDMMQKAKKLFEIQNYFEAENIYQQIVEKVPDNYVALSNLGAVQIQANKLSAAEVALRKAIKINDKDSFALTNLGILLSRQGKFDEAITSLRTALELNPDDAVAHNYLGVCLGQKEERPESEKELKRSIELKPDYAPAYFNLAVLYATTQPPSLDLAKVHYNKAKALGAQPDASLERLIQ
jgi:Flp pilus assembly protein TadD